MYGSCLPQALAMNLVWLPRAATSPFSLLNVTVVKARVLPTEDAGRAGQKLISEMECGSGGRTSVADGAGLEFLPDSAAVAQVGDCWLAGARVGQWHAGRPPFRSVDTPVANSPCEATASDPPRSTMLAIVPPWRIFKRFCGGQLAAMSRDTSQGATDRMLLCNLQLKIDLSWRRVCHPHLGLSVRQQKTQSRPSRRVVHMDPRACHNCQRMMPDWASSGTLTSAPGQTGS